MESKVCLGYCPHCGSEDVDYPGDPYDNDEYRHYPGVCNDCGKEFVEVYCVEYYETQYEV